MEATLIVAGGKVSKKAIALKKLPAIIGRGPGARLTIAHPMISRQHCEVFERDGLLMVRDLGSLNGTLVGGQRIQEAPLPPDGEFSIGPLTFRARYKYAGDLGSLPAPIAAKPSPSDSTSKLKAPTDATTGPSKMAKAPSEDAFEDFLKEIL